MKNAWIAVCLAFSTGCATFDRAGDSRYLGYTRSGIRFTRGAIATLEPQAHSHRRDEIDREVRERILHQDFRFKVWMDDLTARKAFFPGIGEAEGARLDRTADIEVEVIVYADIFPVEMDAYSRQAQFDARFSYLARFNQRLFRELDRLGRIAPAQGIF
jgi:hypothetical protein